MKPPKPIRRGQTYGMRFFLGKDKYKWLGTFRSEQEAVDAWVAEAEARASGRTRETCRDFAERWREDFNYVLKGGELRWGEEHRKNLGYALQPFVETFGDEYMDAFPESRAKPWAANQKEFTRRAVRSMFNDAVPEVCPRNPFEKLGFERSRGRADIVAITEEELHLLADTALGPCKGYGPTMRAFILWQGYVGCRPIATFNIRPEDLNLSAGEVRIKTPGKKKKPRTIIVPPVAAEAVARLPQRINQHWVFTSPRGSKLTNTSLNHHWNKVRSAFEGKLDPRRAAELEDARTRGGMIQLYELRHAAATMMLERGLEQGKDLTEDVAWQLCTSPEKIREVYGHPKESGRRERLHGLFGGFVQSEEAEAAHG